MRNLTQNLNGATYPFRFGNSRMDDHTRTHLANIYSMDRLQQRAAYYALMDATAAPVDWAYDVWDELLMGLRHKDAHVRAISAQVLCNLAVSDPDDRISRDFAALLAVTHDKGFVTARHTLQALWKAGLAGLAQRGMVVEAMALRFEVCLTEKNGTLLRYDIAQALKNLYDHTHDETIRETALSLIETEQDPKYRKKYASVWK